MSEIISQLQENYNEYAIVVCSLFALLIKVMKLQKIDQGILVLNNIKKND